jgi:8-oxo-dGTP diphosphatase
MNPWIHVCAGVLTNRRGEVLICQRRPGGSFGSRWEFPGGKVEPSETPRSCLARELREELGIGCRVGRRLLAVEHRYGNGCRVRLVFFRVQRRGGRMRSLAFQQVRWVAKRALGSFDILEADAALVELLNRPGRGRRRPRNPRTAERRP